MAKIVKDKDTANLERVEPVAESQGPAEQAAQQVAADPVAVENAVLPHVPVVPFFVTSNDVALAIGYTGADEHSASSRIDRAAIQMADAFCSLCHYPETRANGLAEIFSLVHKLRVLTV